MILRRLGQFILAIGLVCLATGMAQAAPAPQSVDACVAGLDAFYAGDDDAALPLLEQGFAEIDPDTTVIEDADCAMVLCSLWRTAGRADEAVAACTTAMTISERLGDPLRLSIAEFTLGDVYRTPGRPGQRAGRLSAVAGRRHDRRGRHGHPDRADPHRRYLSQPGPLGRCRGRVRGGARYRPRPGRARRRAEPRWPGWARSTSRRGAMTRRKRRSTRR